MAHYLPGGQKRPILDVSSEYLIFVWNLPKWVNIGDIKKTLQPRFGWVKFVETFEAWTNGRKIGQIVLQFDSERNLDGFVKALSKKDVFDYEGLEFMRFDPNIGARPFFNFVQQKSGVDLLGCSGVPPTFDYKKGPPTLNHHNSSFSSSSSRPHGRGDRGGRRPMNLGHFMPSRNTERPATEELDQQQRGGEAERGGFGSRPTRSFRGRGNWGTRPSQTTHSFMATKRMDNGFAPSTTTNDNENSGLETQSEGVKANPIDDGDKKLGDFLGGNALEEEVPEVDEAFGGGGDEVEKKVEKEEEKMGEKDKDDEEEVMILANGIGKETRESPRTDSGQGTSPSRTSPSFAEARKANESPQFTQYRDKSRSRCDSENSAEGAPKNTLKISNLKRGFNIDKILEALQNGGDIIRHKALDKTTAVFTFLDESDAAQASILVGRDLAGPGADVQRLTEEQALSVLDPY